MKRFHVHLTVKDLAHSVAFYSKLFASSPHRTESDYAKWMLDEPPLNFAISTRGAVPGTVDHLGFQVDHADELNALKTQATAADLALHDEGTTTCCYARSDKHWITDPQGVAWEHFQTLDSIPVFSEAPAASGTSTCCAPAQATESQACCGPTTRGKPLSIDVRAATPGSSCC